MCAFWVKVDSHRWYCTCVAMYWPVFSFVLGCWDCLKTSTFMTLHYLVLCLGIYQCVCVRCVSLVTIIALIIMFSCFIVKIGCFYLMQMITNCVKRFHFIIVIAITFICDNVGVLTSLGSSCCCVLWIVIDYFMFFSSFMSFNYSISFWTETTHSRSASYSIYALYLYSRRMS